MVLAANLCLFAPELKIEGLKASQGKTTFENKFVKR